MPAYVLLRATHTSVLHDLRAAGRGREFMWGEKVVHSWSVCGDKHQTATSRLMSQ